MLICQSTLGSITAKVDNDSNPTTDLVRPNERNEYDVAEGITSCCFRVILVKCLIFCLILNFKLLNLYLGFLP